MIKIQDIQDDDEIGFIWNSGVRYAIIRGDHGGYFTTGNPKRRKDDGMGDGYGFPLYKYVKNLASHGEMKQLFRFQDQDALFKWMEDGKTT